MRFVIGPALVVTLAAAFYSLSLSAAGTGIIGINASEWNSWGGAVPFGNILKVTQGVREVAIVDGAEKWRPDSGKIKFDSNGVITHIPHKAKISLSMRDGHAEGTYRITYDGNPWNQAQYSDGNIQAGSEFIRRGGPATLSIDVMAGQDPNLFECRLVGNDDYWRPGYVEGFKPFKIVRYMDPLSMNKPWNGPKPPELRIFEGHENYGASAEAIVRLSLATKTQPWICVHHSWPKSYVRNFLQKFKDAGLVCFVEFGNELWNGALHHGRWARQNSGRVDNRVWAAKQSLPVAKIAKEFGFVSVLGTQIAGQNAQQDRTKAIVNALGSDLRFYDYLAGNGYFGGQLKTTGDTRSDLGQLNLAMENLIPRIQAQAKYARSIGLKYALYECGPSIATIHAAEINRHEGMRRIMKSFTQHIQRECDVACLYTDIFLTRSNRKRDKVYAWGLREHGLQTSSPKFDGVMDALGNRLDSDSN